MNVRNTKVSNANTFIEIFILFGFAAFFITTIAVGTVSRYMHPRNIPFMIFAAIAMIIIGILLIYEMYKKRDRENRRGKIKISLLIFFVIPLFMAFTIPPQEFNANAQNVSDIQLATEGGENNNTEGKEENRKVDMDASQNIDKKNEMNCPMENGKILMDSKHYSYCLNEIYSNLDLYEGTEVEAIGFVFKDDQQFSDTNFVVGRLMMVCCAADMQTVGLLCHYDKATELQSDSWVKVIGKISKTQTEGQTIPLIEVESIENVNKPEQDYIYPY